LFEGFEKQVDEYAHLTVRVGMNVQPDQRVIIRAGGEAAQLARLIARHAYEAGASLVDVLWEDDALHAVRYKHARPETLDVVPAWRYEMLREAGEGECATLRISTPDPDALAGVDPEAVLRVRRASGPHALKFTRLVNSGYVNWCVIAQPTPEWADKVFPNLPESERMPALWRAVLAAVRADQADPVAAWKDHTRDVATRRDWLNEQRFTALHYRGPGTDLTVGLPERHNWVGASSLTRAGIEFVANLPTEEVFTTPQRDRVDGTVTATRPLNLDGVVVEGLRVTFQAGKAVDVQADTNVESIRKLLETDEGAPYLGEVALVPASSPINRTGLLFCETLFDENAACHIAFGRAYPEAMQEGEGLEVEELKALGSNDSIIHEDWMIGSGEVDIDGIKPDGSRVPVMRAGDWVF
jgi:aminopeptidase